MNPAPVGFQCPQCVAQGQREAAQLMRGGRRRRNPAKPMLIVLLVAALGAGVCFVRPYLPTAEPYAANPYPMRSQPAGVSATSTASAAPTGPFDGTPAGTYPKGADGFAMPEPTDLDGWSRDQVADSLTTVRAILQAMYLDRRALVDRDPAGVLPHVAPDVRDDVKRMYGDPTRSWPAVLISGIAKLADEQPRVKGRTTFRVAKQQNGERALEIVTNYVLVYPFQGHNDHPGSRLALAHVETTWVVYRTLAAKTNGVWIGDVNGYLFNVDCAEFAKGLLAPSSLHDLAAGRPTNPNDDPNSYYDPERALDIDGNCDGPSGAPSAPSTVGPQVQT
jgi:hypothetical protein